MSPPDIRRATIAVALVALLAAPAFAQDETGADADDTGVAEPRADVAADDAPGQAPSDPSSGVRPVPDGVAEAKPGNGSDYPTVALADYVLGCMTANGNTYESLQQCSCSIDYIRERMDWQDYERASTVMQVQLDRGTRGIFYRDSNWAKTRVGRLQELQAESSLRCF